MRRRKIVVASGSAGRLVEVFNPTEMRAMKAIVAISYGDGSYEINELAQKGILDCKEWRKVSTIMEAAQKEVLKDAAKAKKNATLSQGGLTWEALVAPLWERIRKVKEYYTPIKFMPGYALASKKNLAYFVLAVEEYCREVDFAQ